MMKKKAFGPKGKREMAKWIDFVNVGSSPSGKTLMFQVFTEDGTVLGEVKWYTAWRQYSFFPANDTIFEKTCLRDIAAFCELRNVAHTTILERKKK